MYIFYLKNFIWEIWDYKDFLVLKNFYEKVYINFSKLDKFLFLRNFAKKNKLKFSSNFKIFIQLWKFWNNLEKSRIFQEIPEKLYRDYTCKVNFSQKLKQKLRFIFVF